MPFIAILTLISALSISAVAAYVSVTGMIALFPAAAVTVMVLMSSLEVGKLVAASWLKLNWINPLVNRTHRNLLATIVVVLMGITSLGMYGFLSKGYLEQTTPIAGTALQIAQKEQSVKMLEESNARLQKKLDQLDANINAFLTGNKAERANSVLTRQKQERKDIERELKTNNDEIRKLTEEILPLKVSTAGVEAKLGPIKYVAELFGWQDPATAVRMVIIMLIFVSDPLAVLMLMSSQVSFMAWLNRNKDKPQPDVPADEEPVVVPAEEAIDAARTAHRQAIAEEEAWRAKDEARRKAMAQLAQQIDSEYDEPVNLELAPIEPTPPREPVLDLPKKKRGGNRRKPKVVAPEPTAEDAEAAYQSSLKRLATAYLGGDQTLDVPPAEDKEKFIEILEKRPELLGTLIDVIREEDKDQDPKVQVPESEILSPTGDPQTPTAIPDAPQEQLARNLKPTSWLGRPKNS